MPTVTALRRAGSRLAVELDGRPWRTLPVHVAVEAGLAVGVELDRARACALARLLRREQAESVAVRALARREQSRHTLESRLERAGVAPETRREVLGRATRAGLLDDARFANGRAEALARLGGNLLVLDDLCRHGVDEATAHAAVASLPPEGERIARIVAARGATPRTLRYLAARGFSEESLESLVAEVESRALP